MTTRTTISADERAVLHRAQTVASYAGGSSLGTEMVAAVEARRLDRAELLAYTAARLRAQFRVAAAALAQLGFDYQPPADKAALAESCSSEAAQLRADARSFDKDRDDAQRYRGLHKTRFRKNPRTGGSVVTGGAQSRTALRAFESHDLSPDSEHGVCSGCGVLYSLASRSVGERCSCGGLVQTLWTKPEVAERYAMAHGRAEGYRRASQGLDSVEYTRVYDAAGIWVRTDIVPSVGLGRHMVVASWCAVGYPRPDEAAAAREEHKQALASAAAEKQARLDSVYQAVHAAASATRREERKHGRHRRGGRRGGRR